MKTLLTLAIAIVALLVSSVVSAQPEEVCFDVHCDGDSCAFVEIECPIVVYVEDPVVEAEYEYQRALSDWNRYWEIGDGRL